MIINQRS